MTTEEIVSKYAGGNIKEVIQLQRILEDYTLFIQAKITNGHITAAYAHK